MYFVTLIESAVRKSKPERGGLEGKMVREAHCEEMTVRLKTEEVMMGGGGSSWWKNGPGGGLGPGGGVCLSDSQEAGLGACSGESVSAELAKASSGRSSARDAAFCHDLLWASGDLYKPPRECRRAGPDACSQVC